MNTVGQVSSISLTAEVEAKLIYMLSNLKLYSDGHSFLDNHSTMRSIGYFETASKTLKVTIVP